MVYHTPEVKEQLEKFDIPVLVDYSSYEDEPLGRTEWVKLYGLLTGRIKEAQKAFDSEMGSVCFHWGCRGYGKDGGFLLYYQQRGGQCAQIL